MTLAVAPAQLGFDEAASTPFDPDALMAQAMRRTGLSDFGAQDFLTPLALLCADLVAAEFTPTGRKLKAQELVTFLENRLRLEALYHRFPQINEVVVAAPVVIVGLPRSGTSILFELLALDPLLRAPTQLEAQSPWQALLDLMTPDECAALGDLGHSFTTQLTDAQKKLILASSVIRPELKAKHETGPEIPAECVYFTAPGFCSPLLSGGVRTPRYNDWMSQVDRRVEYRFHRRWLKLLQWRQPGRRWLLKGPAHLSALDILLEVYPDATIVQTHRDPLRVIPSLASLAGTLNDVYYQTPIDTPAFISATGVSLSASLDRVVSLRAVDTVEQRFIDVRYADLIDDPLATFSMLYRRLYRVEAPPEPLLAAVADYLRQKPRDKFGRHRYAPLPWDQRRQLQPAFAAYRAYFDVAEEID